MSKGNPFQHGRGKPSGVGFVTKAKERAANMRIVVRGALARKIGQEQLGPGTWACLFGKGEETGYIASGQSRCPVDARSG